jgi:hypothetical protein
MMGSVVSAACAGASVVLTICYSMVFFMTDGFRQRLPGCCRHATKMMKISAQVLDFVAASTCCLA